MARYVFIKATDTIGNLEAASPQTSDTLGNMPNDSLAIGYGNEVAGGLQYNQILSISTAVEKLLNSSRDRGYPLTGVSLHHYSVATAGTNRDQDGAVNPVDLLWGITDQANNTNVTGEVSLRIGLNFPFPGAGAGAVGDRTPYSSQIVDRCARLALRFLVDWYLKVNETGVGTAVPSPLPPQGDVTMGDHTLIGPIGSFWTGTGAVGGGVITFADTNFDSILTNTSFVSTGQTYRVTWGGTVLTAGTVTMSLGDGAGGATAEIANGQTTVVVTGRSGNDTFSLDDTSGSATGFVFTGPIIINIEP